MTEELSTRRATRRSSRSRTFDQLLAEGIRWPFQTAMDFPHTLPEMPRMVSSRMTQGPVTYESRKMLRTVRCESKVERGFFAKLDNMREILWFHEQAPRVRYRMHGAWRWYYPDAVVALTNGHVFVAEVKMTHDFALFRTMCKANALFQQAHGEGRGVFLGNCATGVGDFLSQTPHERLEAELLATLKRRPRGMSVEDYKDVRTRAGVTRSAFQPLIFKERLVMTQSPFNIRRATRDEEKEIETFVRHFESDAEVLPLSAALEKPREPETGDVSQTRPLYGA